MSSFRWTVESYTEAVENTLIIQTFAKIYATLNCIRFFGSRCVFIVIAVVCALPVAI